MRYFACHALALSVFGVLCPPGPCQQSTALTFEVATIKPAAPSGNRYYVMRGGPGSDSPGQLTCTGITLRPLILRAWGLRDYQLVGPSGLDGGKYDIIAKIPSGATREQVNLMLRELLAERFGLVVHTETRDLPIYEMTIAKSGIKLRPAEEPQKSLTPSSPSRGESGAGRAVVSNGKDGVPELPPGAKAILPGIPVDGGMRTQGRMVSITEILTVFERQFDRPVIDRTGTSGLWDFTLLYSPIGVNALPRSANASGAASDQQMEGPAERLPDLFSAFESQLGLKLQPKSGPVQVLVVDKVNRAPTEN